MASARFPSRPVRVLLVACALGGCEGGTSGAEECPPGDPVAIVGFDDTVHLRDASAVPLPALLAAPATGPDEPVAPFASDEVSTVSDPDEPVPIGSYAFGVATSAVPAEGARPRASGGRPGWTDLPVPRARALSCLSTLRSVQALDDLVVVSDRAFGPDLPAGTDLGGVAYVDADPVVERIDVGTRVATPGRFRADGPPPRLDAWRESSPRAPLRIAFRFDAPSVEAGVHVLSVTLGLEGGETFTLSSDPVALAP